MIRRPLLSAPQTAISAPGTRPPENPRPDSGAIECAPYRQERGTSRQAVINHPSRILAPCPSSPFPSLPTSTAIVIKNTFLSNSDNAAKALRRELLEGEQHMSWNYMLHIQVNKKSSSFSACRLTPAKVTKSSLSRSIIVSLPA